MNIEEEKCYICLENLNIKYFNDNKYLKCGCLNRYHTECLDEWAEIQNTCPICRKKINEIEEDNDNEFYPVMYFIFYILITIWFLLCNVVFFLFFISTNDI